MSEAAVEVLVMTIDFGRAAESASGLMMSIHVL